MDISNYANDEGPMIYYNDDFRAIIESHVDFLKNHKDTRVLNLEPHIVYRYEFDMYGLLLHYKFQPYLHWIILRINDLYSMQSFPTTLSQLLIPNDGVINQMRQIYQTKH